MNALNHPEEFAADHVAALTHGIDTVLARPLAVAPTSCPWCGADRLSAHHYRDAGSATPQAAQASGYCPVLAARRERVEAFPLTSTDARLAARLDLVELSSDDYAELLALAMKATS